MGPMRAARRFVLELVESGTVESTTRVLAELYGSLALTGLGHGTDLAVLLGLSGEEPSTIDSASIDGKLAQIRSEQKLWLMGAHSLGFHEKEDLLFHRDQMFPPGAVTQHPNGVRFTAFDSQGSAIFERVFFSIGGGF